jgi:uncharacterized membrane protein
MKNSPIKISAKTESLSILIILAMWAVSIYFYLHFPDRVPTHWDVQGQINGWSSKSFGAFFVPGLSIGLYLLLLGLPSIDPKKENYKLFSPAYHIFKNVIILVLFGIYLLTGFAGLGYHVNIGLWIPAIIGVMFIILGFYMEKLKLNWMMGFRNMWTLSSEKVWDKTNRLAGKLFMVSGLLIGITSILPPHFVIPVFILAVLLIIIVPTVFSYIWYQQESKKKK